MSDWLHSLPVLWMALVIFGFTYLLSAAIYLIVMRLAVGEHGRSFAVPPPALRTSQTLLPIWSGD